MAIGEVIKTEEHGGKPSLTIKWDDKPQGWGYKSMNDYGQIRHDLTQFQVGDMVEFEIEVMTFKGQSYDRIGSIKKVSDEPDTSFSYGDNRENRPDEERVVSSQPKNTSNNKYDDYLKEITQAYSAIESNETLKNLDQENKRAIAISAVINQMRNGR